MGLRRDERLVGQGRGGGRSTEGRGEWGEGPILEGRGEGHLACPGGVRRRWDAGEVGGEEQSSLTGIGAPRW